MITDNYPEQVSLAFWCAHILWKNKVRIQARWSFTSAAIFKNLSLYQMIMKYQHSDESDDNRNNFNQKRSMYVKKLGWTILTTLSWKIQLWGIWCDIFKRLLRMQCIAKTKILLNVKFIKRSKIIHWKFHIFLNPSVPISISQKYLSCLMSHYHARISSIQAAKVGMSTMTDTS